MDQALNNVATLQLANTCIVTVFAKILTRITLGSFMASVLENELSIKHFKQSSVVILRISSRFVEMRSLDAFVVTFAIGYPPFV